MRAKSSIFDRIIDTGFGGPGDNILAAAAVAVADSMCNWDLEQHKL